MAAPAERPPAGGLRAETGAPPPLPVRLHAHLLRLYPRRFRTDFAAEMNDVFATALTDARRRGGLAPARLLARELAELPLTLLAEHRYERRTTMTTLRLETEHDLRTARWTARLLSLFIAGFVLLIALGNEDVRQDPTLPALLLAALSIGLLLGWRWERLAAWVGLAGAPLLFVAIAARVLTADGQLVPPAVTLLVAAAEAGSVALVGWLYAGVARVAALAGGEMPEKTPRRGRLIFLLGGVTLLALALFLGPLLVATTQTITPVLGSEPLDDVGGTLLQAGAVVGVGSPGVVHPAFAVEGEILIVDDQELWVFRYPDVASATADATDIFRATRADVDPGNVIQRADTLLVYRGTDPAVRALIVDAFGTPLR